MQKIHLLITLLLTTFIAANAQFKSYTSSSGEMIFSFAKIEDRGSEEPSTLRWSPVFNIEGLQNFDFNNHVGAFIGLNIRNVGFIYETPNWDTTTQYTKQKFRSYNLGLPIGIKLGNLKGGFIYGGYEIELPFHYKQKYFVNDDKVKKITGWFSNRTPDFMQSWFVGINFPGGFNIKAKYYITPFLNPNYTERDASGATVQPYKNLQANVFFFSIAWNVFKNVNNYGDYNKYKEKKSDAKQTGYSYNY